MKKEVLNKIIFVFLVFIMGSFIGFVHENIWIFLKGKYALRQGLVYLPLIPIYGFGALVFYFTYKSLNLKNKKLFKRIILVFLIGFVMGGFTEYMCSYLQEKIFGTISWDYRYLKYNLNGRTSLYHAFWWGVAGILYYELLRPFLELLRKWLDKKWFKRIVVVLIVILLADALISTLACTRQMKRRNNMEPSNKIEEILDKYYPDERLNRIYNNARVPRKKK